MSGDARTGEYAAGRSVVGDNDRGDGGSSDRKSAGQETATRDSGVQGSRRSRVRFPSVVATTENVARVAHAEGRHSGHAGYFAALCPECADAPGASVHGAIFDALHDEPRPLRVLSLGAGVQSTCVLLMSLMGDLPPLDAAIFADTGWEPAAVYEHLTKLEAFASSQGLDIRRVSAGNIRTDHVEPIGEHLFIRNPRKHPEYLGKQRTFMPFFIAAPSGGYLYRGDEEEDEPPIPATPGGVSRERPGKTRRTCTKTYKIEPVEKELRALLGLAPRQRWPLHHAITQVFGISYDEVQRMSDPGRPAIVHEYPLVDLRMTRDDCHAWMADHGWTAPRSAARSTGTTSGATSETTPPTSGPTRSSSTTPSGLVRRRGCCRWRASRSSTTSASRSTRRRSTRSRTPSSPCSTTSARGSAVFDACGQPTADASDTGGSKAHDG